VCRIGRYADPLLNVDGFGSPDPGDQIADPLDGQMIDDVRAQPFDMAHRPLHRPPSGKWQSVGDLNEDEPVQRRKWSRPLQHANLRHDGGRNE
jgi:hypothetical protein